MVGEDGGDGGGGKKKRKKHKHKKHKSSHREHSGDEQGQMMEEEKHEIMEIADNGELLAVQPGGGDPAVDELAPKR